jgi:hypothetical protein
MVKKRRCPIRAATLGMIAVTQSRPGPQCGSPPMSVIGGWLETSPSSGNRIGRPQVAKIAASFSGAHASSKALAGRPQCRGSDVFEHAWREGGERSAAGKRRDICFAADPMPAASQGTRDQLDRALGAFRKQRMRRVGKHRRLDENGLCQRQPAIGRAARDSQMQQRGRRKRMADIVNRRGGAQRSDGLDHGSDVGGDAVRQRRASAARPASEPPWPRWSKA